MGKEVVTIPFWKKCLSYIKDVPLDHRYSEMNGDLTLLLVKGRFQLCTENAIYSYDDLYDNFTGAFRRMNLDSIPGDQVLLLGLGLGSIPIILEKKFNRQFEYTAVELDEEIVALQEKYTSPRLRSNLNVVIGNAHTFVLTTEQKFDLICIDVFVDEKIPEDFKSTSFLENIKSLLHPEGIVLFNHLGITPEDRKETRAYFNEIFKPIFPKSHLLSIKGNYILFNNKGCLS